ncbi:hypothetical protein [Methylorubrum zatmanii]|uniref:Uncharacterized protein n=2 Tax=Methylorubrum TaxID=2282523 RepID=A0A921E2Z8_9HYPH|nr:hypothetical protein [Methylorubrum zatmanii]MBD8908956.1 hypothetical protein [Methylorubrum zatmanii]HJE24625.1 hypothetical protein [Methylorubrum populi]
MTARMSASAKTAAALVGLVLLSGPVLAQGLSGAPLPSMDVTPAPAPSAAAPMSIPAPMAPAAPAQSVPQQAGTDCNGIQKTLIERKNLVAKANAASNSKKKMTPQEACSLFGQLQANGATGIKWITANKEWCSIPDSFAEGFKADHNKVGAIRTKVCGIAAQASKMEAQARSQAQNGGGGGLLGGPGLSGSFRMPQGAL